MTVSDELGALQRLDTEMVSLEMSSCHGECSDKKRKLLFKALLPVVTTPTSQLSPPHTVTSRSSKGEGAGIYLGVRTAAPSRV